MDGVMTFELPAAPTDLATELRELEQNAPNVTPKAVRAALVKAAAEIEQWRSTALRCAEQLEEAGRLRTGQMDSQSRLDEVDRQVKFSLRQVAERLRAKLNG